MSEEKAITKDRQAELREKYNVRHHHKGKWKMDGDETLYANKDEAFKAAAAREVSEQIEAESGDVIPEGYENFRLRTNHLVRGSVMELPMNERYDASGGLNPLYDREFVWAWAYQDRQDIALHRAKGYRPVEPKEFKQAVKDGVVPEFISDLVYEEGSFVVYGDVVLMRCPRFIWRQRQKESLEENQKRMGAQQAEDSAFFRRENVNIPDEYIDRLGLENSISFEEV